MIDNLVGCFINTSACKLPSKKALLASNKHITQLLEAASDKTKHKVVGFTIGLNVFEKSKPPC